MATKSGQGLQSFPKNVHRVTVLTSLCITIFTGLALAYPTSSPEKSVHLQAINGRNHHLESHPQIRHQRKPDLKPSKMVAKVTARAPGLNSKELNPIKPSTETEFPTSFSSTFNYDWLNFGSFNYPLNVSSDSTSRPPITQRPKRKVPHHSVGLVRWTRNTMANIPEPMKRIVFPRCPFFPCPDNHACDLSTNSCRLLLYQEYE